MSKIDITDEEYEQLPHSTQHTMQFRLMEDLHKKIDAQQNKCDNRFIKKSWIKTKIAVIMAFVGGFLFALNHFL